MGRDLKTKQMGNFEDENIACLLIKLKCYIFHLLIRSVNGFDQRNCLLIFNVPIVFLNPFQFLLSRTSQGILCITYTIVQKYVNLK